MTTSEILTKIDLAIQTLYSNDHYLLVRRLNERSIAFKLAEYLQPLFNGYNVDCEYNGDAGKENDRKALAIAEGRILEIGIDPKENNKYCISPDIIIHKRGLNTDNLVVIEIKKDTSKNKFKQFDLIKLEHLTIDYLGNHYNYKLGIALVLDTGIKTGASSFAYFQNGLPKYNRQDLE